MPDLLTRWLVDPLVGRLVASALTILLVAALVRLLHRSLARYIRDADTRYRTRKFTTAAGSLVALGAVAVIFSDRLGGLTVALGVAGAGIAFALQEVIASVAGWLAVSFGGFYKVGDRVQLGGIRGDVIDIGILRTTLMECGAWIKGDAYSGRIVRVANSFVFKEPVFNYSGDFPFLWDEVTLPIKYGSDYQLARRIIQQVGAEVGGGYAEEYRAAWAGMTAKYLIEDQPLAPAVTMAANENWLEFTLRYVVDFKSRRATKDRLFVRILEEIDRVSDRVGIAASTLNIEKLVVERMPRLDVHLAPPGPGPGGED